MKSYDIVEWGKPLQEIVREDPVPKGTEVLVRVEACGVCHSDLHIREGFLDLGGGQKASFESLGLRLPFTLGHEIVGTVIGCGPDAQIEAGVRRVIFPWIGCGTCRSCLRGDELACESNIALGTRRPGGFSNRVLVPHPRYLLDFGTLDPDVAATCACSGLTAWSALRKLPVLEREDVVVLVGAGGLGQAALSLASWVTDARIVMADIDESKLRQVRGWSHCETFDLSQPDAATRMLAQVGEKARAIIDFVGSPATLQFGMQVVGKGGTVVVVGLFGGALALSTALLPARNLSLRGSYVGTLDEMRELLDRLQEKNVLRVPIQRVPMAELNQALELLARGRAAGRLVAVAEDGL